MSLPALFWHVISFIAPAIWLGLALAVWGWGVNCLTARAHSAARGYRGLLLDWAVGIAVLCAGLVITGHDGRMATYGALALAVAARRCWPRGG